MDNQLEIWPIGKLVKLKQKGRLNLQPPFQRNSIWPEQARIGLIDTVFRGMPIPEIFLWQTKNKQHEKSYWTVDGQQRLTTIIDFINGKGDPKKNPKFMIKSISKSRLILSPELKEKTYAELDDTQQSKIEKYEINVRIISEKVSIDEIEDLFTRLNTNVYETNDQELRNLIHGDMQKLANELTKKFRDHLLERKLTSEAQMARQKDTDKIINEILLCAVNGDISGSSVKKKDNMYKDCIKYSQKNQVKNNIIKTKMVFERILTSDRISGTMFTKHTNYLTLFTTLYLMLNGKWKNPKGKYEKYNLRKDSKNIKNLQRSLDKFSTNVVNVVSEFASNPNFNPKDYDNDVRQYVKAISQSHTTNYAERKMKCVALFNVIKKYFISLDASSGPTKEDRLWLWSNSKKNSDGKPTCAKCGDVITKFELMDCGHINPEALGGPNDRENYQAEHIGCNRRDNNQY